MANNLRLGDLNFDTSWEGISGGIIEAFVRQHLKTAFRAFYFDASDNNTLKFFSTVEDKDLYLSDPARYADLVTFQAPLSFAGIIRQVKITNNLPSTTLNFTTNQEEAKVSMSAICQEKSITDTSWTDTPYGLTVKVLVDTGATGSYEEIQGSVKHVNAGETYEYDVRKYLATGNNRIRVQFTADDDDATVGNILYSCYLSEMYIEPLNLNWWTPFIEGSAYNFGGFRVVGAVSKTLHLKISKGANYSREFTKFIGTSSYINTPLFFQQGDVQDGHSLFPEIGTGVYEVDVWLTSGEGAGSLESLHITYSIMCVAAKDTQTAKLVCVNEIAKTVYNYDTNRLFKFAIYNGGFSTGTPNVKITAINGVSTGTVLKDETLTVEADAPLAYDLNLEWIVESSGTLELHFDVTYGDCIELENIPIDNTGAYPATGEYLMYFNAANRTNAQANRENIINEANLQELPCEWERMVWVDGIDGWTTDDKGRNCLRIPAGSKCTIPYRVLTGDNISFEITFKVSNVADYDENVITIATNPESPAFQGIRIRPTNVTIHNSNDSDDTNDTSQGNNFSDEEVINLLVTITRNYDGNQGKNLVTGYINGSKNFQFQYTNVIWANNAPIILGARSSDLYVYTMRTYGSALGVSNAEQNYINSLASRVERIEADNAIKGILNGRHEVDYELVKNSGYNFFVVEMLNGATIPQRANGWAKDAAGHSNFEMHYGKHPEWDYKLYNVETSGQGTTSMDYYRWNLRFRIDKSNSDKKINVAYFGTPTKDSAGNLVYNELPPALSKTVWMDGGNASDPQHPAVKRITAKTNQASSTQSHKMGATMAFNMLHDVVLDYNEAQSAAASAELPHPLTAVYQYPAFGFKKEKVAGTSNTYVYEFIGLFTIGADKGDKPTFGYDLVESELISLEGTDHTPRMATFRYPWNDQIVYRASNQCLNIITGSATDAIEKAWEAGNIHGLSNDKAADEAAISRILTEEFKPAYDVAYNNSTLIFGIPLGQYGATAAATLAAINADTGTFNGTRYNDRLTYGDMEFWIEGEHVLYHQDKVSGLYVAGVNLVTENGTPSGSTVDEKNEWFKEKRRARFKAQAGNYWDIDDCLFHLCFLVIFGATDNFAKNSYPYKMKTLANGGRWKWRQDDLDTIMPTDNQGKQTKPYYIEYDDVDGAVPYFKGSNSALWTLFNECYVDEIRQMGKSIISAMQSIGGGSNAFAGVMNFFKKIFWDNAQNYFPKSAYNMDASYKYEASWLDPTHGQTTVNPLEQSLGDSYMSEYLWALRRTIYACSLYHAGAFGAGGYNDNSLGMVSFRATIPRIDLETALTFYPAVHVGNSSTLNAEERIFPSDGVASFPNPNPSASADTILYIPATDWLTSLGDLSKLYMIGASELSINGKRLQKIKLGDENPEEVTTNVTSLVVNNTPSLEVIDARNAAQLGGDVDLTGCTRLKEALFEGTRTALIQVPSGSKIEKLHLSDATNTVQLRNLKYLTDLVMPSDTSGITTLQVENCAHQDSLQMMEDILNGKVFTDIAPLFTWTNNVAINVDGGATSVDFGQKRSDYVDVSDYEFLKVTVPIMTSGTSVGYWAFYDAAQKVVDKGVYLGASRGKYVEREIAVPEGAVYFRTSAWMNEATHGTFSCYGGTKPDSALKYIRVLWDNVKVVPTETLSLLAEIGRGSDEVPPRFRGVTATGAPDDDHAPTIEGTIKMESGLYMEDFDPIGVDPSKTEDYDDTLKIATAQKFGTLKVIYNPNLVFVSFADDEVKRIVLANWDTDRDGGITLEEAANIGKSTGYVDGFGKNTTIETFDEFRFFTSITQVRGNSNGTQSFGFNLCSNLRSIILPPNCKSIGAYGFNGCSSLENIGNIENVTYIGNRGLSGTTSFVKDLVLENISSFGSNLFAGSGITKLIIGGPVTTIPNGVSATDGFATPCRNLTEVKLPATITSIGSYAFSSNPVLAKVDLGGAACSIGDGAFRSCPSLDNVIGLENVVSIGASAFNGAALDDIELNLPSLTSIGYLAFYNTKVKKVVSLGSLKVLTSSSGGGNFQACADLEEVNLSASLEEIGLNSFYQCTALKVLNIPSYNNIRTIGIDAFRNAPIEGGDFAFPNLQVLGNGAFQSVGTDNGFTVSDLGSITMIDGAASRATFYGSKVRSVVLPETCETVNHNGFYGCTLLEEINLESVRTFGNSSFTNAKIKAAHLDNAETIGDNVFYTCPNLKLMVIGSNIASIGARSFYNDNVNLVIKNPTPPTAPTTLFGGATGYYIYVPTSSVADYQAASGWSTYASRIKPFDEVTVLPSVGIEDRYYLMNNELYYYDSEVSGWRKYDVESGIWRLDVVMYDKLSNPNGAKILTDIIPQKGFTYDFDAVLPLISSWIFGADIGWSSNLTLGYNGGLAYLTWYNYNNGSSSWRTPVPCDDKRHVVVMSPDGISYDGNYTERANGGTANITQPLGIFCENTNGTLTAAWSGTMYRFTIRDAADTVFYDLRPATLNGTAGLYDIVNDKFYGPYDSNQFVASNE